MANKLQKFSGTLAAAALFAVACGIVAYFILFPAPGYYHSDWSDTLYWAQASYQSGRLFDPSFSYAAMLPFGGVLFFLPYLPIWGVSIATQTAGMLTFAAVFIAAMVYFFRSWRFTWRGTFLWSAVLLMLFSMSDKLREMFWGHIIYYSLFLLFLFFGFGLLGRVLEEKKILKPKNVIRLVLLFVFSFLVGTDGLQVIFIFIVPLVAAIFLERFLRVEEPVTGPANRPAITILVTILTGTLFGYITIILIKNGQTAGYADAHFGMTPVDKWIEHLLAIPVHWITLLGVEIPQMNGPLFTIVDALAGLGVALFVAVFPLLAAFLYKKTEDRLLKVFTLFHFILAALIVLGCVFGSIGGANWRWIPTFGTGLILSILTFRNLAKNFRAVRFVWLFAPILLAGAVVNAYEIAAMPEDYGRDNQIYTLTAELESRGLTYGYADFWLSQAITVVSGSEVVVRGVEITYENGILPYHYQSSSNWYEDQEGIDTYFLLLTDAQYGTFIASGARTDHLEVQTEVIDLAEYTLIIYSENILN